MTLDPGELAVLFGGTGTDYHHVTLGGHHTHVQTCDTGRLRRLLASPGDFPCRISVVPRTRPDGPVLYGASHVLWAALASGAHERALTRFRPAPSLVVREGDTLRRVAVWWLSDPVTLGPQEDGCRRIAHALGTAKKYADPGFMLPVPGSRVGRNRVRVEFLDPEPRSWDRVAGGLRPAPDPVDWRALKEAA